jgi:hypothetical protein
METTGALKGHGFSRAAKSIKQQRALAPEGSILLPSKTIPQGPDSFPSTFLGTDEAIPFQNKLFPYSEMRLPCSSTYSCQLRGAPAPPRIRLSK